MAWDMGMSLAMCTILSAKKICIFHVTTLVTKVTTLTTNPILNYNICNSYFSICKVKKETLIPLKEIMLCNTCAAETSAYMGEISKISLA